MVGRILFDNEKAVVSKPGKEVTDAGLADEDKLFDSRWAFTSFLLQSGFISNPSITSNGSLTVNFPDTGSIPFLHLEFMELPGANTDPFPMLGFHGPISGYPDQSGDGHTWAGHQAIKLWQSHKYNSAHTRTNAENVKNVTVTTSSFTINWKAGASYITKFPFGNQGPGIAWFLYALPI